MPVHARTVQPRVAFLFIIEYCVCGGWWVRRERRERREEGREGDEGGDGRGAEGGRRKERGEEAEEGGGSDS